MRTQSNIPSPPIPVRAHGGGKIGIDTFNAHLRQDPHQASEEGAQVSPMEPVHSIVAFTFEPFPVAGFEKRSKYSSPADNSASAPAVANPAFGETVVHNTPIVTLDKKSPTPSTVLISPKPAPC